MTHLRSARGQGTSQDGPAQFDFAEVADVDRFVDTLARFERGEIGADEWRAFRLVHGTYGQRQEGDLSMLRVKLPQGAATSPQLRAAADVADRYSRGFAHMTTRQNFQFHFVKLSDVEHAMRAFAEVGVTTREACGNAVRNITTSPTAGVAADEVFDPTPYSRALTRYFLRHPLSSTLPRKFKIAFSGGGADHSFAPINDIGWVAAMHEGKRGFRVTLAGGTATMCSGGNVIREFLPAGEMFRIAEAVLRVFHRLGDRVHRQKNRMKFLVKALGWERFKGEIETELAAIAPIALPFDPESPPALEGDDGENAERAAHVPVFADKRVDEHVAFDQARNQRARAIDAFPRHLPVLGSVRGASALEEREWREWNVRPQKQAGYSLVTIHLPLGDITSGRLRVVADVAEEFADGTIRATLDQNFLLRWIKDDQLTALFRVLTRAGLARPRRGGLDDVVSCPGAESCKLAVTRSRGVASLVQEYVASVPGLAELGRDVAVHVSGCPNGCGLHHVAGIGLQGGMRKISGKPVPQYFVYAGGGVDEKGAHFGKVVAKIPARRVPQAIERLLEIWRDQRRAGESFPQFARRTDPKVLKTRLADLEQLGENDASPEDFIDLGETEAFAVTASEGECVA